MRQILPKYMSFSVIAVDSLHVLNLKVRLNSEGRLVEEGGESIGGAVEEMLAHHPMLHLCLHDQGILLLEEFVMGRSLSHKHSR